MEEKKTVDRKKPKFLRTDWHKKIRLGRGLKKKQKWHGAKGRQNKLRLGRKGRMQRPKIGWGAPRQNALLKNSSPKNDFVLRTLALKNAKGNRILNLNGLKTRKKGDSILIGAVGMRKRKEIIAKANEMGLKVLNRYKKLEEKK